MLDVELAVEPSPEAVRFAATVRNDGDEPVELRFSDAQRLEVVVTADGEPVWRASEGRMFAQVLGRDELPAGGSLTYEATWSDPPAGDYEATVEVVARDRDLRADATFSV